MKPFLETKSGDEIAVSQNSNDDILLQITENDGTQARAVLTWGELCELNARLEKDCWNAAIMAALKYVVPDGNPAIARKKIEALRKL